MDEHVQVLSLPAPARAVVVALRSNIETELLQDPQYTVCVSCGLDHPYTKQLQVIMKFIITFKSE